MVLMGVQRKKCLSINYAAISTEAQTLTRSKFAPLHIVCHLEYFLSMQTLCTQCEG